MGGIAIGFALKGISQNFMAGILLLFTEPFRIGDQIPDISTRILRARWRTSRPGPQPSKPTTGAASSSPTPSCSPTPSP
ncbi:mechanosensitive ion channel domain-containing protein [Hymenobacter jeongseonensis]|uniref:mechanosensitive ion channel domain-containing protein n=1 Tax=Hymenobacter jeongseonensis TaxID=2791027 RepID=UPI0037427642